MTTADTARAVADVAALGLSEVLAATSVPGLLQTVIRLTHAIAAAPDEDAADRLRIARHRVSAELERRIGGVA